MPAVLTSNNMINQTIWLFLPHFHNASPFHIKVHTKSTENSIVSIGVNVGIIIFVSPHVLAAYPNITIPHIMTTVKSATLNKSLSITYMGIPPTPIIASTAPNIVVMVFAVLIRIPLKSICLCWLLSLRLCLL